MEWEWLEKQTKPQRQILSRERELNMRSVLSTFNRHVPATLKRVYPDADIQSLGNWAGFTDEYHCFFCLHESLFAIIQKKFFEEQERLFGTDHIYGVDSVNEMGPLVGNLII